MNRISRNLSIILRAERMIARRNMAVLRNQSGLLVFAAFVGTMGLVMLNIAAFVWLEPIWSPPLAALAVALVNLGLALVLVTVALRLGTGPELEPITEVRNMAIEELESEVQDLADELRDVGANVRRLASDPFGSALPALAMPLISALLRAMRKDAKDPK